ncbi:MAG: chemotaxis-specific protein-glutamate methyltransferase CheB [Pseudomonadota bacterium]|nr:chemotaxis-specific protein-glutamate methyltransferase CheB [Pseudomonadota bacterium]
MTKLLVVDDSALVRKYFKDLFAAEPDFELDFARSGREAVLRLHSFEPDVLTLDVNMPEMDGLTALSQIMSERPTPVVMVSALTTQDAQATLEALALGAVDHIAKPGLGGTPGLREIGDQIRQKVRAAARSRVRAPQRAPAGAARHAFKAPLAAAGDPPGLVVIGVSTGGPRVLEAMLPQLPLGFPWPLVVVQHMPGTFTGPFAQRLDRQCVLQVQEASERMPLECGHVYVAQGGRDAVLLRHGGRVCIAPKAEDPGQLWHPSVDVLMRSALGMFPPRALIGVMLTGMGYDGAEAMAELHRQGGRTVAESEDSAVVWGMPGELVKRRGASQVARHEEIPVILTRWLGR